MNRYSSPPTSGRLASQSTVARPHQNSPRARIQPSQEEVQRVLSARRARAKFFDADLFADPAWDILLEMYAAERGQRRISVSSLCVGSNVPSTTALRWIRMLEERGLLNRVGDPLDARRVFVSLSDKGSVAMAAYFQSLKSKSAP